MNSEQTISTVAITGALGNLGWKLLKHLARTGHFDRLIGLDIAPADPGRMTELRAISPNSSLELEIVECDLSDWHDRRWRRVLDNVEAVVHFAALNPYPNASWHEAAISFDMTLHVAHAASDSAAVRRMVFATSNHVMGRYKDNPLAETVAAGELTVDLPPAVGTLSYVGDSVVDSAAYATSKLMGERLCRALGARSMHEPVDNRISFVCVRIGWCQPGENRPETLSGSGTPGEAPADLADGPSQEEIERADTWFKGMWLSNRDFVQLFERAIVAQGRAWPDSFALVNGMSDNKGMKWSLAATRELLAYEPQDGVQSVK